MRRGNAGGLAPTAVCGVASIALLALTSDFFLLAGSTPATVLGPTLGPVLLQATVALAVLLVGVTMLRPTGIVARAGALGAWVAVLSIATHRVIDANSDGISDVWLGIPVSVDRRYSEADATPHDCHAILLPALCFTRGGNRRVILTVVPFDRMTVGRRGRLMPVR